MRQINHCFHLPNDNGNQIRDIKDGDEDNLFNGWKVMSSLTRETEVVSTRIAPNIVDNQQLLNTQHDSTRRGDLVRVPGGVVSSTYAWSLRRLYTGYFDGVSYVSSLDQLVHVAPKMCYMNTSIIFLAESYLTIKDLTHSPKIMLHMLFHNGHSISAVTLMASPMYPVLTSLFM
ncbi:predicted protein [Arabidopsis lyrata subsp. lyrata]|uniref:Predicted protein n=1 Tax=Arabidopsis lyrata subsp. lyrata TaxID=81972 RepID=D7KY67_ARALL|nr:predicted protein [Arabidopsis lyrata subsp. lyrata]